MNNPKAIRVAMVEPVGGHRGNEFYDFGLCQSLTENNVAVNLYTCDETHLDKKHHFDFKVKKFYKNIYGKDPELIRGARYAIGAFKTVRDAVADNLNVVHFHIYHFANREYLNLWLFKRKGFKVVATVHDVEAFDKFGMNVNRKKYKRFEKNIDQVIVHSTYAKECLQKYFSSTPGNKIHVVPNADHDFLYQTTLSKQEVRKELNFPIDKKIILFFGQIKKVKGLDLLLKAYSIVRNKIPDTKLAVIGIPWKVGFDEFQKIIDNEKLNDDCLLNLNYVPNEDISLYYRAADMVVLPYRKIYSSGVMIKSLHYSASIIASDLDVFKEIITDGKNGLLFTSEDGNDLAEKIIRLLNNDKLRNDLSHEAINTANEKYSWKIVAPIIKSIYRLAMND